MGDIDPIDRAAALTADDLVYEPIIAWTVVHIQGDYDPSLNKPPGERWSFVQLEPVTLGGELDDHAAVVIKQPNGEFNFDGDSFVLPDEDALLKKWNESRGVKC